MAQVQLLFKVRVRSGVKKKKHGGTSGKWWALYKLYEKRKKEVGR